MPADPTLRDRLRHDTRAVHDALDADLSGLDLTDLSDLRAFLLIQHAGLSPLQATRDTVAGPVITDLLQRLERDLGRLTAAPAPSPPIRYDPLAVDYIVLGSRLGTSVLRKRWARASDPAVLAIDSYFTAPPAPTSWQHFSTHLDSLPGHNARADRIVSDTLAIFRTFARSSAPCRSDPVTISAAPVSLSAG